jgi:hypothetical protein
MSTIFLVVLAFGLLGAATFIAGFVKGVREALRQHREPQREAPWSDNGRYGISAVFAVLASAAVITLVGENPLWIYAGPLLAIVTATGVGLAFLIGERDVGEAVGDP